MNQKYLLWAFLIRGISNKRKFPNLDGISAFLLGILFFISISTTTAFASAANFPTKTVKLFNEKVKYTFSSHWQSETSVVQTSIAPCPGGSGVIGGKIFSDFNYNGLDDQSEAGIAGIEVYIFGCDASGSSQAIGNTLSDENGAYFFSGLTDGEDYRIEFHIPEAMSFLQSGFNGADSRTTVQFVSSPSCATNIGLANPADFCEADPSLAIPCFVNGDPLAAGSGSADEEALVIFKTSYENGNPKPTVLATASQIGATWGVAYQKETKKIFASAFLKRHVGLGPLGLGGLYQVDISGAEPVVTSFLDVNTIGINVGTYPSNSARGLTANINLPNNDTQAFDEVGKKGLGGMCMSEDGTKLYVVNLTEKKLHSINIGTGAPTSADVQSFTLPNPNCTGGEFRPFGVRMNNGKVYVGGVCDAEASGNKSDLRSIVYRLDGTTFTEVLNFSLDYTKGKASRTCEDFRGWFPWTNELPAICFSEVIVYPTPQLTAMEFDEAGDIILGFSDRMGNQLGYINYPPIGTDRTVSVFTGGDILKAGRNADGSFTIENNGTAGGNTTGGAGNEEGPGGGEFYFWDAYDIAPGIPRPHSETAQGGLALVKGSGMVISTALDPFGTTVNSGGVNYFNNKTGDVRDPGYRIFRSGASSPASFSKANGLGDLVALCGDAPIEIGGRLWIDANEDGIQDPCETPFPGVQIALYTSDGQVNEIVETDANGEYYFNGDEATIAPNSDYFVVIGFGDQVDNFSGALLDSFFLTVANTGMGPRPDLNDSDGAIATPAILNNTVTGWPSIQVTTGGVGSVTHDNDAGFIISAPKPKANITGFVWNDINENGLQNAGEEGILGVTVSLFASNNTFITSTSTDAGGNYIFEDLEGKNYYLVFDADGHPVAGDNFEVTLQDVGSDETLDSDISQTDERVDFILEPLEGNADFDAGYTLPLAQVVGSVFNDLDKDGLQGNNEPQIAGVTITLVKPDGTEVATVQTDANGNYAFDDIMQGDYYVVVNVSTNNLNIPNFQGTIQDAGDDDFDSDVNPSTGQSDIFTHNPSVGNTDVDAGFFEPTSAITGFVWNDINENGLQNAGENGIPQVDVQLINANGEVVATTTTDANGIYNFEDVKTGNYTLGFDASDDPVVADNFEVTLQDVGSDETLDSDIRQSDSSVDFAFDASQGTADYDAGYTLPLANIMGIAFDDIDRNGLQGSNEPMIGGVTVTLFKGDGMQVGTTTTDANGNYSFTEVMGATYYIVFDVNTNSAGITNYVGTIQDAGDDDFDSDADPNTGRTADFTFQPKNGNTNYDAGYYIGTGTVTGQVFNDLNENGLNDPNDPPIGGVKVTVIAPDGIPINASTSLADGSFAVSGIPAGTVTVLFDPDDNSEGIENLTPTLKDVNNNQNDDIDSDINPNKEADPIDFDPVAGAAVDAGFFEPVDPVMIGDFVFKDCNENGIQDAGEVGIPNVPVILSGTNHIGESVQMEMTTNSMGKYTFTVPRPGTYTLDFDIPEGVTGLEFSPKGQGGNNATDSDVNPLSGATDPITLASGESTVNIDAGVIDNSPPLIFNVPPDVTVDCNDIPNPPNSVKGVDNCDPSIEVTFSERIINEGSCPYIIERTWMAVDDCGNSAVRTQKVTVTDTEAPVITIANPRLIGVENGGEIILDCDNLPEFTAADVNATDNCSDVEVKFVDLVREQGDCAEDGFIVKMTCGWIAEDDCGNRSEFNIVMLIVDTKSPTLQNIPEDLTINLDQGQFIPPVANTVTATDNCDEFVRIEFEETQEAGVCGYEIIRTWTGFDDCGNKSIESQKLTLLEDCTCPEELVSKTLVWDAACDGSMLGMITLDLTADLNKYTISISPEAGTKNLVGNMYKDLPPGDYTVTVRYDAIEECVETYDFTIKTATPATIQVVSQTQADCFTANGTVTVAPANYTYQWSDGGTGAQRNNLAAGEYIVTFTDDNQCQGSQVIIITNPDGCECIDFKANLLWEIMPTCNDFTNGQVDIEIMGGTAPYTYLWHDGQTTKDLFGVSAGPYSVTVTDVSGCTTTLTGDLDEPEAINVMETLMNGACGEKGAIDIFVSGGTPPYKYNWSNGETTEDLTSLVTGNYTVTVTDANDCQGNLTVTINNSGDISIELTSTNPICDKDNTGSITSTVTGGVFPLSYQWSNGATTSSIQNVIAGTYAVMVTDATGCKAMAEVTLTAPSSIMVNLTPSTPTCGMQTGSINAAVNGGTAPYTYAWDFGATTQNISNLVAGQYAVTITDANSCTGTATATVVTYANISAVANTQNPACGGENGSITLAVSGGQSPYTYNWSNGATTKDLTNVTPGNYTVTITDANSCTMTVSSTVESTAGLEISNTINNPSCAGEGSGAISINISGGQAPYTYAWSNGATTKDLINLMPGGYTLTVTDANGCVISTTAVLEAPGTLEAILVIAEPSCEGDGGSVDVTITGGTAPYTYAWSNGATTEDLNNVAPGDYTIMITDANACQVTFSATVTSTAGLNITENIGNPSCAGVAGGSIDINVTGGTPPYTYSWTNNASTEDISNLMPGGYSVVVTDAKGCRIMETFTLSAPGTIEVEAEVDNPDCSDENGKINSTVTGGTAPYTFLWSNGATTEDLSDIAPGSYTGTVTDANGCTFVATANVEAPAPLTANTVVKDQDCSGDGTVDLTVSGGTPPYNYVWSNGATTEDLPKVGGGQYSVVISDANDCKLSHEVTVESTGGIEILVSGTAPTCPDATNGSLSLEVKGGTQPYSYQWSNGSQAAGLANIPAGSYMVTVTDAKGCSLVGPAVLDPAPEIIATAVAVNPICSEVTGNIDLTVSGGTGSYTYAWDFGATSEDIGGLVAGTYTVTITDANGCTQTTSASIIVPNPIMVTATPTNPGCDGTIGNIALTISGGTAPYTYSWSNGSFAQNLNGVAAGTYSVTVADANGCLQTASASIANIDNLSIKIEGSADPTCANGADGFINISAVGGVPPYTYQWTNGATTANVSNLTAGFYAVTVADSKDCKVVLDAFLEAPADIELAVITAAPNCPNDLGTIDITVTGGTSPYQYKWNNGATTEDISNATVGNYQVEITDANGCTTLSQNIIINAPNDFDLNLTAIDVKCFSETNGEVLLTVNGAGTYTYAWSNGATTQNINNLAAGTYSVIVTNAKGCRKTGEVVVNMPPSLSLGMTFSDPQCPNDLGAVDIDVRGGTPPYNYAWSNGASTEDINDLTPGKYSLTVTDDKGCVLNASATIQSVAQLTATFNTSGETCTSNDGLIDITVSGGTSPYSYQWSNGTNRADLEGVVAGTYSVTITDAKGCFITETVEVTDDCECPQPLISSSMVTNSTCGEANGAIMIFVNGDINLYTFQWSPDAGVAGVNNNERTQLAAGTYDVTVTYANKSECTEHLRLRVNNKNGESGSVHTNKPADCGMDNGQIILNPTVDYEWPDGSTSENRNDLASDTYEIKMTDANGCMSSLTVTVTQAPCMEICDLEAKISKAKGPDCDGNMGYINLKVDGGTAPYSYEWNGGSLPNQQDLDNLSQGAYNVVVTDANGCTANAKAHLKKQDCDTPTETCNVVLSLQGIDLTCDGENDGSIGVNVLNGTPPYIYKWNNGETEDQLDNLAPGEYWVEVTDANGCRAVEHIQIKSPGALVVTEIRNVFDCEWLEITLKITGGRPPYRWDCGGGQSGSTDDPLELDPGTYDCEITDGSGCSIIYPLIIEDYESLEVSGVVTNTSCGNEDGSIDITATGGTSPYTYEWDCGLYSDEDQHNLGAHTYGVTVTDASNCTTSMQFTVEDCGGASFGFISINAESVGEQNVKVDWTTVNEVRKGKYIVLHSTDGENFEVVGRAMDSKGPVNTANYAMEEAGNLGRNYYKIKYIDTNENVHFSEVAEVVVFIPENQSRASIPAIIYPNPTHNSFTLDFAIPIEKPIEVTVTDIHGTVLEKVTLEPGTPKRVFDVMNYDSGVYQVTLEQRRKKLVSYKIVKAVE